MDLQFCFQTTCAQGVSVPRHTHPALELVYYVQGTGESFIGPQLHPVQRHVLAIIPAHIPHDQTNFTDLTSICVGVCQSGLEPLQGTWNDTGGVMGKLFSSIHDELTQRKQGYELVTRGLLLEVQGLTQRLAHEAAQPPQKAALVNKAVEIIQRCDGALSVADIASQLYISKDYLRHLFGEYAGQSPLQCILQARLEKAQALLGDKNLRISEIAERCGFEDVPYFSRFFRKVTGQTPTQFREARSSR